MTFFILSFIHNEPGNNFEVLGYCQEILFFVFFFFDTSESHTALWQIIVSFQACASKQESVTPVFFKQLLLK